MLITIFYIIWILYTVGTLGLIFLFGGLIFWANWENDRHQEKIRKLMNTDLKEQK